MSFEESKESKALNSLNQEIINLKKSKEYQLGNKLRIVGDLVKSRKLSELLGLIYLSISKKNNKVTELEPVTRKIKQEFNGRIAVYTCIIGPYDKPEEPLYISPQCDYFIITDQKIQSNSVWKKIDSTSLNDIPCKAPNEVNRFVKLHPDYFFSDYDYSIYVDGNIVIVADMVPLINQMSEDQIIGIHRHDRRDCAYTEMETFKHIPRLQKHYENAKVQMNEYRKEGFPEHYGLFENPIIIRKHNDSFCKDIMSLWWKQLTVYSMRDQISLPYVLWKMNVSQDKLFIMGNDLRENSRFIQREH